MYICYVILLLNNNLSNLYLIFKMFRFSDPGHLNKYTYGYIQENGLMLVNIVIKLLLTVEHLGNTKESILEKNLMLVQFVRKHSIKE